MGEVPEVRANPRSGRHLSQVRPMSRPTTEKIIATVGVYRALATELPVDLHDPRVQAALIESSSRIALGTVTQGQDLLPPILKDPTFIDGGGDADE